MFGKLSLGRQYKNVLICVVIFALLVLWICNTPLVLQQSPAKEPSIRAAVDQNTTRNQVRKAFLGGADGQLGRTDSPSSFAVQMLERQQLLREQCLNKPPNPSFIKEADFTFFIVIEKLKVVFCFIPKVACTTWQRLLYSAEHLGKKVGFNPHSRAKLFRRLEDYTPAKRREILDTYYKAMFVRDPFERLASAYRDKVKWRWFQKLFFPENKTLGKNPQITFSTFIRRQLLTNKKTTNQHWRSFEQLCPCEVNYDFIGHFENLTQEATQLLKIIGVNDYVTFPEYRPSKSQPYMLEYYSQLKKDEIFRLGEIFHLDLKLFGYDFPGSLDGVLKNKTIAEKSDRDTP